MKQAYNRYLKGLRAILKASIFNLSFSKAI